MELEMDFKKSGMGERREGRTESLDPSSINSEFIKKLEIELYVKRNNDYCLAEINKAFDTIRSKQANNRHKCMRSAICECSYFGLLLADIFSNHNQSIEFSKLFESYFYCCPIYLPIQLFQTAIQRLLDLMEFTTARVWIETYLTYTVQEDIKSQNPKHVNKLTLTKKEYNDLVEKLVFDIILVKEGFKSAGSKLRSFKLDSEHHDV